MPVSFENRLRAVQQCPRERLRFRMSEYKQHIHWAFSD
ncbi:hypothetical protein SPHINGO391_500167 [Sphingomonas aurantiaca]|uniref:Uncharacterized protein n=1 Tax=Sphingomonas aurantiaca TaxID=185949 RepID=A0A5E8AA16_9SPHN|nr:hypothetical protein SPHINGO391_500167 [Sphingomonas aurantiaca]